MRRNLVYDELNRANVNIDYARTTINVRGNMAGQADHSTDQPQERAMPDKRSSKHEPLPLNNLHVMPHNSIFNYEAKHGRSQENCLKHEEQEKKREQLSQLLGRNINGEEL